MSKKPPRKPEYHYEAKTPNQEKYLKLIDEKRIIIATGPAGTGKTLLALCKGLDFLYTKCHNGGVNKIVLMRPAVEMIGEKLGALPGSADEKISPYMFPLLDNLQHIVDKCTVEKLIADDKIHAFPIAHTRGTAQPLDIEIPTPTGVKKFGNIKSGDVVFTNNGGTNIVSDIFPQGITDVYKVKFSDGSHSLCCGDHLWNTMTRYEKRANKGFTTKKTTDIIKTLKHNGKNNRWKIKNHRVPILKKPVKFKLGNYLPISPYIIGCLIGDGSISCGLISISAKDNEIINNIKRLLPKNMSINYKSQYDYNIVYNVAAGIGNPVKKELVNSKLFGKKSHEKFIPKKYLFSSVENRIELLRGLIDTDGWVGVDEKSNINRIQFYTTSKKLANDMQFLVRSLGGISYKRKRNDIVGKKTKLNRHVFTTNYPLWVVDIKLNGINPAKISRKADLWQDNQKLRKYIDDIEYVGKQETMCISVWCRNGLYLTNDFIVTHNTMRSSFVIIDEAQNSLPSQLKCILTRLDNHSKIVLTGDLEQTDIKKNNGLQDALARLGRIKEVGVINFTENDIIRGELIKKIIRAYRKKLNK